MFGVSQQVPYARRCYISADGSAGCIPPAPTKLASPVAGSRCRSYRAFRKKSRITGITATEATVHIRKTRYGSGDRPISLVFVECVSDEHPELLDDAPALPPQAAEVGEADEMVQQA